MNLNTSKFLGSKFAKKCTQLNWKFYLDKMLGVQLSMAYTTFPGLD